MISKPRFRPSLTPVIAEPELVFLLSERRYVILKGGIYSLLVPYLDGQHTIDDITAAIGDRVSLPRVLYALHMLQQKGHIVEGDTMLPRGEATFWDYLHVPEFTADERLRAARVAVETVGNVDASSLITGLAELNIQPGGEQDFLVVVTDDYLRDELAEINAHALANSRPWMLVKPVGMVLWLGPIFRPYETGCWECLAQRLRANRQVERYITSQNDVTDSVILSRAATPDSTQAGINLAVTEIARIFAQPQTHHLDGKVITLDLLTLESTEHVLVRRPQCPACGDPAQASAPPGPLTLQNCPKRFTADGGHWSHTPHETFEQYQHLISPITGVVSWFKSVKRTENGLTHNYTTGHSFPITVNRVQDLHTNMRYRSGGKGTTEIQAKVSALGEAVERYSGIFWGDEYCINSSYNALLPDAIHPNACMLFGEGQYERREGRVTPRTDDFQYVPRRFDEDATLDWTPIWSLTEQKYRYLPTTFCYYGHPDLKRHFAAADSNGCAAGNSLEEAVLQGFCELVERDSVAIWWYNRVKRPAVDIDSFDIPYLDDLKAYYATLERDLWALDLTNDLGVPTFAVISRQLNRAVDDIIFGFSAHLDPQIALLRAATEMNQYLPAFLEKLPDGRTRYWWERQEAIEWWQTATLENQPYLLPDPDLAVKTLSDYPALASDDVRDDVLTCAEIARQCGLEMLVLDQTRPDIGFSVARVVIPGLRHFWLRLAPGRLYDVPVNLGWLAQPHSEDQLNPIPIFV